MTEIDYPKEWDELPKRERKKKIKDLKRQDENKVESIKKIKKAVFVAALLIISVVGFRFAGKKTPEKIEFEQKVEEASLQGKVEEFPIEGREHVSAGTSVNYKTNPPTSGGHLDQAENWGVYDREIDDKAAVHALEHGGIWISYKDIAGDEKAILEKIGQDNSQSVIVSPRSGNDVKIAVVSWGKMMKLDSPDGALIQKYIDTYKNQSPEKLAR